MWKLMVLVAMLVVPAANDREDPKRERPIHQAQQEADRGTGRVVDDATYEIDRIQNQQRRTTEEILADQDRQERIERRQKQSATAPTPGRQRRAMAAPAHVGAEITPEDLAGGERLALMVDVLSTLDEHDRRIRVAHLKLSSDPEKLKRRELELQDAFSRRLAGILDGYEVKRTLVPTTTQALPAPGAVARPTTRAADRSVSEPIRLPVQTPR